MTKELEKVIPLNSMKWTSLVLFKNGNEVARIVGLFSKEKYETFVNNALNV